MGAYNFKKRFEPRIRDGSKRHTIRAKRKYPAKPGEMLYLYTGLRTKQAQRITVVECTKVEEIRIIFAGVQFHIAIDGVELDESEKELLAQRDGFANFAQMMEFWDGRLPFLGDIIHWKPLDRPIEDRRKRGRRGTHGGKRT